MTTLSVSIAKGKGSLTHNNRVFFAENVDIERTKDNIIYKRESLESAYKNCFEQAIHDYNAKQKRADRKINGVPGYMEQIRNSGNGEKLFYENIVQVGNMYDCGVGSEAWNQCKTILNEYMNDFEKRNPNLYVFNAVLHLDEQTPHLHIDYIPLATNYQRGLNIRNSLDRALKQQGIDGKSNKYENSTVAWQNSEKNYVESIMNKFHIERAREKGLKQEHKSVGYYKAVVNDVRNQVKNMSLQIDSTPTLFSKDKVTVKKSDLEQLEKRAKLSVIHEKSTKKISDDANQSLRSANEYKDKVIEEYELAINHRSAAELELIMAEEMNNMAKMAYNEQLELSERYDKLLEAYRKQQEDIKALELDNRFLRSLYDDLRADFDEMVQKVTKPLEEQIRALQDEIEGLKHKLANMYQKFASIIKAFNMFRYDKASGYQVSLNQKQSNLFTAIQKYVTKALRQDKQEDLAIEVEKYIGISQEINDEVKKLNKSKSLVR